MFLDYFARKSLDWIKLAHDSPAARVDTRIRRLFSAQSRGYVTNSTTVSLQRKAVLSEDITYSQ